MGFKNGAYAKVWEVIPSEKYTKIRISTSKKDKDTSEYKTDFSGFCKLIGKAHKVASGVIKAGDKIKIGECEVTTDYNAEKKQSYTNYIIWDIADIDGGNGAPEPKQPEAPKSVTELPTVAGGDLPF